MNLFGYLCLPRWGCSWVLLLTLTNYWEIVHWFVRVRACACFPGSCYSSRHCISVCICSPLMSVSHRCFSIFSFQYLIVYCRDGSVSFTRKPVGQQVFFGGWGGVNEVWKMHKLVYMRTVLKVEKPKDIFCTVFSMHCIVIMNNMLKMKSHLKDWHH